ncbi:tetratricopeptide repeat protein [Dokdonella soli]|uniref:Tetratricopeptide repeat protein n=2 Tax=Dokdonella soli TaxID=529810 RepID=A0ABN1IX94_9GAMM
MAALVLTAAALPCAAAALPARYVDLIRHENYVAAEALADAEIARAEIDVKHKQELLCAALEQRVRVDFFDNHQLVTTRLKTVERALQCRERLGDNVENAARIAWLKARLTSLTLRNRDPKRAAALLAETAPQIRQYRERLGATDYAMAALDLSYAADASNLAEAYAWAQAGADAVNRADALSRMIRVRLLDAACFRLGRLGRFAEAEAAGKAGIEAASQTTGEHSLLHSHMLFDLGQVQYFAHHFADAQATLDREIADDRQLGPPARLDLAVALGVWGNLQRRIGNYDRGRTALIETIAVERSDTTRTLDVASALNNLGTLEAESGHCEAAITPMREALELERQRRGADNPYLVPIIANLGRCEIDTGQIANARADISQALSIAVKTLGESNPEIASIYQDMGEVELAEHNYAAATQRLQHALSLLPADPDTLSDTRIPIERNLARSLHGEHADEAAFEHAVAAETARQRLLQRFAGALDESGGLNLRETQPGGMDQVLALAAAQRNPTWIERAWRLQIGARSLITHLVAARLKAARGSTDPQMQALWEQWKIANAAYAAVLLNVEGGKAKEANLAAPRNALESSERALAGRINGLGGTPTPDLAALRANLPAHSALVGFALSRDDPWAGDRTGVQHDRRQRYYAFRLDASTQPALIDLGDAHELGAAIRGWTASLRDPARAIADVDALGKDVAQRVWQPLDLPGDLRHVFLVPEGELHRVAWLALPLRDGPLVEEGPVPELLDSERDLLAAPGDAPTPRVLLVGAVPPDPSIAAGACGDALHALPGARRELDALRELWNETGAGKAAWLVGGDANKAAVRAAMPQSTTIHFATHAFSDDSDCMHHLLASRSVRLVNSAAPANAPALSGLLLASNAHAAPADRDGVLTASEIAAMRLDGVHAVTLAACDTGTGPVRTDEGVFGLARAFRLAGARNVVMSLWNVDDAATADLMQRMYRARWIEHASATDALATAARATLAARRAGGQSLHPYYWAAFVAAGDWR